MHRNSPNGHGAVCPVAFRMARRLEAAATLVAEPTWCVIGFRASLKPNTEAMGGESYGRQGGMNQSRCNYWFLF